MMASSHVFAVPGYAARPAKYASGNLGIPDGEGMTFQGFGGSDNWYHFPITVPLILNGNMLRCSAIGVTLELDEFAFLRSIWAFDATGNFFQGPDIKISGVFKYGSPGLTFFELYPPHPVIGWLGISVYLSFDEDSTVKFTGASASFE